MTDLMDRGGKRSKILCSGVMFSEDKCVLSATNILFYREYYFCASVESRSKAQGRIQPFQGGKLQGL